MDTMQAFVETLKITRSKLAMPVTRFQAGSEAA